MRSSEPIQPFSPYPRKEAALRGSIKQLNDLLLTHSVLGIALVHVIGSGFILALRLGITKGEHLWETILTVCLLTMCVLAGAGWRFAKTMDQNPLIYAACGLLAPLFPPVALIGISVALSKVSFKIAAVFGIEYRTLLGFRNGELEDLRAQLGAQQLRSERASESQINLTPP